MQPQTVLHTIPPVYDQNSRILILGTMPSPKSRETGFYYGHPRNRFWPVLAAVLEAPVPRDIQEKKALVQKYRIALWDVLASCEIAGAQDASIRNPQPNPIETLLSSSEIRAVFTTGQTAYRLYQKYCLDKTGIPAISLPSTSPANAAVSLEELICRYQQILPFLKK